MTEFTIEDSLKKHDKDKDGQISKKEFLGKKKYHWSEINYPAWNWVNCSGPNHPSPMSTLVFHIYLLNFIVQLHSVM